MALIILSKYKSNTSFDRSLEMLTLRNKYPRRMCVVKFIMYFFSRMTTDLMLNVVFSTAFLNQWFISVSYCKTAPVCEFAKVVIAVLKSSLHCEAITFYFCFYVGCNLKVYSEV
jgi:hypothetical protein